MNKTNLVSMKARACVHTIMQLEEVLKLAKEGKIKNVFIIAEYFSGEDPMFEQAGEHDPVKILGLLDWAKAAWREAEISTYRDARFDDDSS